MCFITCICSNLCFSLLLEFVATFKYKNRYWYRNDYLLNLLFSVHFYTLIILSILLNKSAIHCFLSYSALKGKKTHYTKTYTTFNKISCFLCFFSHTIVLEYLEETKLGIIILSFLLFIFIKTLFTLMENVFWTKKKWYTCSIKVCIFSFIFNLGCLLFILLRTNFCRKICIYLLGLVNYLKYSYHLL